MSRKVLISAPYLQKEIHKFGGFFEEHNLDVTVPKLKEKLTEQELLDIIEDFDGVACGDDEFTRRVMEKAKKLKVISKWGTGINTIDQNAAKDLGIRVCNTENAFSHPVADTALAYMLAYARNVISIDKQMKQGIWDKVYGHTLSELTLGIIGLGNIGLQVAKRARAFNMKLLANDIKKIRPILLEQYDITMVSKEEIYEKADIITIHCDLNDSSYHLLNKDAFHKMEKKPFIINTARGGHIAHNNLLEALDTGLISGAALDVFEQEPLPADDALLKKDNVILAPHNANSSPKYWDIVHKNTLNNLVKYLEG